MKLGTILLHKRAGTLAFVLSTLIHYLDPDPWVRQNYKLWGHLWHMSFICGWDNNHHDWIVRSVGARGVEYKRLSEFKEVTPVNWFDESKLGLDLDIIDAYCDAHPCKGYYGFGYIVAFFNRITRGRFPAFEKKGRMYCWQDVAEFCEFGGKEWQPYGEMAYMPTFFKAMKEGNPK